MAKGGHANSGPPPDPNALRRDRKSDQAGWTTLPSEGRKGDAPDWPLGEPTPRELVLWSRQWAMPQAVEWERNRQFDEVALYVRAFAEAERHGAPTAARTLVKQLQEALGISLPGMARLRWRIGAGAAASAPVAATGTEGASRSARDRLKVVPGGEA